MIKIVAKHLVKQDQVDDYIELMGKLVAKTRQLDDGCIEYGLYQDLEKPNILTIIEEWESQNALDKHMEAAHFNEIVPKLDAFYQTPGDVNFYRSLFEK